jgi:hypothetical protein
MRRLESHLGREAGTRPVAVALTVAAIAATVAWVAPVHADPSGTAAQAKQNRYTATRPLVIDQRTGRARMPTETELAATVESLAELANRDTSGVTQAIAAGGAVAADLDGGFGGVMLARPSADGTWETLCVFTFEEGAAFLGLVEASE